MARCETILILAAALVALGARPSPAADELQAVGREFRPTLRERTSAACIDAAGITARVYHVCEKPYDDGSCEGDLDLFIDWRGADGKRVAGPVKIKDLPPRNLHPYGCAADGAVMVAIERSVQVFDRNGPRGPAQPLCTQDCAGYDAAVTSAGDGFFATWLDGWGPNVNGRFFRADATGSGDQFLVHGGGSDPVTERVSQVTTQSDADGNVLVAWQSEDFESSRLSIRAALADPDGGMLPEIALNEFPHGRFDPMTIRAEGARRFLVAWENADTQAGWVARRVRMGDAVTTTTTTTTTLEPDAPSFLPGRSLASIADFSFEPALLGDESGRWIASWTDNWNDDPSQDWRYGPVIVSSDDDARRWYAAQPVAAHGYSNGSMTVARDDQGVWIMAWSSDGGEAIRYHRSTNGGRTWDGPGILAVTRVVDLSLDITRWISPVALAAGNDGRWIAAWSERLIDRRWNDNGHEYQVPIFCGVRSTMSLDSGSTWSEARTVRELPCSVDNVAITTDEAGKWLIAWIDARVTGVSSMDDGQTWSAPRRLLDDDGLAPTSLALACGGPGDWLLSFTGRVADASLGTTTRVFVSETSSVLGGWGKPAGVAPWHRDEGGRDSSASIAAGNGQWGIAWTSHSGRGGGLDADIVAAFSSDGGKSWSTPRIIDTEAATDSRTDVDPRIAHGGADTWGVLWRTYEELARDGWEWENTIRFARTRGNCGNGTTEAGEECDDGDQIEGDGCDSNCLATGCGNEIVTAGEECDDGNADESDGCISDCRLAACGDGFPRDHVEECDDGNASQNDSCLHDCTAAACGDGLVWEGREECDDGDHENHDACVTGCILARCGDGHLHAGFEECDDGNDDNGDRCNKRCRLDPVCGRDTGSGQGIHASDALRVLRKAVGMAVPCPMRRCDADGNGRVTAADALQVLRRSVGLVEDGCLLTRTLTVRLESSVRLGALGLRLDYSDAPGDIVGSEGKAHCTVGVSPVLAAMHWDGGRGFLNVGIISGQGFGGPADLLRCEYRAKAIAGADDFDIVVEDVSGPNFERIEPPPLLVVTVE